MGFENVGEVWTVPELSTYLSTLEPPVWCDSITLHHTGVPDLTQRPAGFTDQHLRNMEHYYRTPAEHKSAWSSGPHLFIDDDQCWGMCSFLEHGVHASSFNSRAIGIEVLGNYNVESHTAGRGADCWNTAIGAAKALLDWLGLTADATTVLFHRDDPRTSKQCPGSNIEKSWVLGQLALRSMPMPMRMGRIM